MFPDPPKDWLIEEPKEKVKKDRTVKPRPPIRISSYTGAFTKGIVGTTSSSSIFYTQQKIINKMAQDFQSYNYGIMPAYYETGTAPQTLNILKESTPRSKSPSKLNPFKKIGKICQHGIPKAMCRKKGCK